MILWRDKKIWEEKTNEIKGISYCIPRHDRHVVSSKGAGLTVRFPHVQDTLLLLLVKTWQLWKEGICITLEIEFSEDHCCDIFVQSLKLLMGGRTNAHCFEEADISLVCNDISREGSLTLLLLMMLTLEPESAPVLFSSSVLTFVRWLSLFPLDCYQWLAVWEGPGTFGWP